MTSTQKSLQTLPVAIHHHNFRPLPKTLSFRASSSCFFSSCHFDLSRKSSFQQKKHTVLETKKPFALHCQPCFHVDVSKNRGTPKSSILIGFSIINHPFWDTPIFGNTHVLTFTAIPRGVANASCLKFLSHLPRKSHGLGRSGGFFSCDPRPNKKKKRRCIDPQNP